MRCFIGLDLAPRQKLGLENWREQALPDIVAIPERPTRNKPASGRGQRRGHPPAPQTKASPVAVPTANYHITLCFLGHITPRQHEALTAELANLIQEPIFLNLDCVGFWQGPKILFVAPRQVPDSLQQLASACRKAARRAGIETDKRDYRPHVTIVRKAQATLPIPELALDIACVFSQFHLFESVSTHGGVSYPIRASWPLSEPLTVRERLKRGLL
ncbi:RNA 2',3'-cyclic phosphodiesterase [Alteromonas aestuariivivens]|uniref:RNA 2',3'-cyclic phosphodiesterase n=1 Tax=Alteromonas aestuariivivens TaxID=1938339 RepID=A0A3D8M9N9_9ALTE|nr:RNA 2',3'-cyclic phosphodiesterase [Alteromonas aestuariivivens]RDV26737.1 RNA 2',3'-cyclic phosphodiesterase [Alteromonas aestuariivivens]